MLSDYVTSTQRIVAAVTVAVFILTLVLRYVGIITPSRTRVIFYTGVVILILLELALYLQEYRGEQHSEAT